MNIVIDDLKVHQKAIIFASQICVLNIKRKGSAPAHVIQLMKTILSSCKKAISHPEKFQQEDLYTLEDVVIESARRVREIEEPIQAGPSTSSQ